MEEERTLAMPTFAILCACDRPLLNSSTGSCEVVGPARKRNRDYTHKRSHAHYIYNAAEERRNLARNVDLLARAKLEERGIPAHQPHRHRLGLRHLLRLGQDLLSVREDRCCNCKTHTHIQIKREREVLGT